MDIAGCTALVTGANRGLGTCFVAELLAAGAGTVYATARRPEAIEASDPRVRVLALDVTDQSSVEAAAAAAGDVDLLINNAGVNGLGHPLDGDLETMHRDVAVNYLGTVRTTRSFVPVLRANSPAAVVNVVTIVALAPVGMMGGYCASKAALHSYTQALRAELRGSGVDVVGAYPAGIDTDMMAGVDGPKADPTEVARRVLAAVAAGESVVFPDDMSAGAGALYVTDPVGLEKMFSGA